VIFDTVSVAISRTFVYLCAASVEPYLTNLSLNVSIDIFNLVYSISSLFLSFSILVSSLVICLYLVSTIFRADISYSSAPLRRPAFGDHS